MRNTTAPTRAALQGEPRRDHSTASTPNKLDGDCGCVVLSVFHNTRLRTESRGNGRGNERSAVEGEGPLGAPQAAGLKVLSKTLFVGNGSLKGSSGSRRGAAVCRVSAGSPLGLRMFMFLPLI